MFPGNKYRLHQLCMQGTSEAEVRKACKRTRRSVNTPLPMNGGTPQLIAAQLGHEPAVRVLVTEFGANVNATLPDKSTPLYLAAQEGHTGIVHVLVDNGAEVNYALPTDGTASLLMAVQFRHDPTVKALVAAKANVNQVTHSGMSPLYMALPRPLSSPLSKAEAVCGGCCMVL